MPGSAAACRKLFYLPEAHTDFLFAIYAEEFGFVGQVCLIAFFGLFALRCFAIAKLALQREQAFGAYLAYGVGLLITLQAVINIGVNMGALPTKGLTLPFVSYGGNSILSMSFAVGLVLRVYLECTSGCCTRRQATASEGGRMKMSCTNPFAVTHPGDGRWHRRACFSGAGRRRMPGASVVNKSSGSAREPASRRALCRQPISPSSG